MSNKSNRHKLSNQPAANIQQQHQNACFRLGQEIANERRAQRNQEDLADLIEELEAAFTIASNREAEAKARKDRDEANKKDRAAKAATTESTATAAPTTTESGNDQVLSSVKAG